MLTVRVVTVLFFLNTLLWLSLIWLADTIAPALIWYPIGFGVGLGIGLYFLAIYTARREKEQARIENRIHKIREEIATRRARNAHNQPTY